MVEFENIHDIAVTFVKEKKNVTEVNVSITEIVDNVWVIKGTCPIDLCGHPWRESFEIKIDKNGKIKDFKFTLM